MQTRKQPDHGTLRGISAALQQTFNGANGDPPNEHVGAAAADADFAALLAQLNDPPAAYQQGK